MSEAIIGVIIGGILATTGGFLQTLYQSSKDRKVYIRSKRDEAYLGYIDALLRLKENNAGMIEFKEYNEKYFAVESKLKLYASDSVLKKIKNNQDMLYECWECNGFDVNNALPQINSIIETIRNDLDIK